MAKQIVLSHTNLAKVASGVPISQVEHEEVDNTAPAAPPVESGTEETLETPDGTTGELAAPAEPADESAPVEPSAQVPEMVEFLKGELAAARTEVSELQVKLLQAEASLTDLTTNSDSLLSCAIDGAARLQVMLGQSPVSMEGLPATAVTAQYAKFKQEFESTFKVGQQSLSQEETAEATDPDKEALKAGLRPVG